MTDWHSVAVTITIQLGRDTHLKDCDLARAGGPDATLACAECGRALWMHSTRHDTCGQFCWVTERTLTPEQVQQLQHASDLPEEIRLAGFRAFNSFALAPLYVREARRTCAAAINAAKLANYRHLLREASKIKIGVTVRVEHQLGRDRGYVEAARTHRRLCDGLTGITIAEHDAHGLCYEVRFPSGIVVTFDREELEEA